jgi:hypothetical protein
MWFWICVAVAVVAVLVGAFLMDRRRPAMRHGGAPDRAAEQGRAEAQLEAEVRRTTGPTGPGGV